MSNSFTICDCLKKSNKTVLFSSFYLVLSNNLLDAHTSFKQTRSHGIYKKNIYFQRGACPESDNSSYFFYTGRYRF